MPGPTDEKSLVLAKWLETAGAVLLDASCDCCGVVNDVLLGPFSDAANEVLWLCLGCIVENEMDLS